MSPELLLGASDVLIAGITPWLAFIVLTHATQRLRASDSVIAAGWAIGGSLVGGTGVWTGLLSATLALRPQDLKTHLASHLLLGWAVCVLCATALMVAGRWIVSSWVRAGAYAGIVAGLLVAALSLGLPGASGLGDLPWTGLPLLSAVALVLASAAGGSVWVATAEDRVRGLPLLGALILGLGLVGAWALALTGIVAQPVTGEGGVDPALIRIGSAGGIVALLMALLAVMGDARSGADTRKLASSLREAHETLRGHAQVDALTGLANRITLQDSLRQRLAASASDQALALLSLDLDGFKVVNDSFGQAAGDRVLIELAGRLRSSARAQDVVARVSADEFLFMFADAGTREALDERMRGLSQLISQPFSIDAEVQVQLSCSIGVAFAAPGMRTGASLMGHADAARAAAKRNGGATVKFYESSMSLNMREWLALQGELRRAIERNELELFYQPKMDGRTLQVTGAEALVRWRHPTRGLLGPGEFIPVAERFGLINSLGDWVIEEACRQIAEWRTMKLKMRVAVNLSVHQLRQNELVPRILEARQRHNIDASLLTFEITESVAMEDPQATLASFGQLADIGVGLSIDDFGTGYSSLAYLRKMPADQIKIDRSFVSDLGHDADALAVVDAVIKLAHALGLIVVAEGVETEAQREALVSLGCDELQGYLFAKPMPAQELTLWALDDKTVHAADFRPSLFADTIPQDQI